MSEEEPESQDDSDEPSCVAMVSPSAQKDTTFESTSIVSEDDKKMCPFCQAMTFYVVQVKGGKSKFLQCHSCGHFEKIINKK